jgi:hypothetical protein
MVAQVIGALFAVYVFLRSGIYLWTYLQLKNYGIHADGSVVTLIRSGFFSGRTPLPKVNFKLNDIKEVVGTPIHSSFTELNGYLPGRHVTVYADIKQPGKFVVKSNIEVVINFCVVIAILIYAAVTLTT